MQTRFLLGPAGSGKTSRCLNEIADALRSAPDGPPLILLAPKQATFQLERQLLAGGKISGFARLHIFSFDKLARFVLERFQIAPPSLLSGEGRTMVLRALLMRHEKDLNLFHGSARRPGFAQELSALLKELQQHQLGPARLRELTANENVSEQLRRKLNDLALLQQAYTAWLTDHQLQDSDGLLDAAITALGSQFATREAALNIEALWLDGFAEMTPQELALLVGIIPQCRQATLAFCLETEPTAEASWLSIWSAIGKTFHRCRDQIANLPGGGVETETLPREPDKSRFVSNPALTELEQTWSLPVQSPESAKLDRPPPDGIRVARCADPEAEAQCAARAILKFVRAGRRFRDCAVLVRNLENYHRPLARVFRRYEIPFFLDRREAVTHHPLAELTRNALRTVAFDWQIDDWFAALKAGFSNAQEPEIDRLENAALEHGWRGRQWHELLPEESSERLRREVFPPFETFHARLAKLNFAPDGGQLTEIVRELWTRLRVQETLERWTLENDVAPAASRQPAIHATVWEQMDAWLDNVARAFPQERLSLRDWLPILEAGLAGLTVGVIPPALDQVLVGAVDRARNPDLKFCLVLGTNETIFPATPPVPVILTHGDRDQLALLNSGLGPDLFERHSRERYLGYIACTRASEQLTVTLAHQDKNGKTLNPSPFIAHLQRIFPSLGVENFSVRQDWLNAEHGSELTEKLVELLRDQASSQASGAGAPLNAKWLEIPALKCRAEQLAALREPMETETLSPAWAEKLYGPVLNSSVSRLEEFAECPFKFFARSGLRAAERKVLELDARERGNFQHDVLKAFHEELTHAGKRWRDLTPREARARVGRIAAEQMQRSRDDLFRRSAQTRFAARSLAAALQDFVEIIVGWMHSQYDFDPAVAELAFGGQEPSAPAWEINLDQQRKLALQGRIDRVDLWRDSNQENALAVVMDYKSGGKKLDPVLVKHGVQLQLLAYLGALRHWQQPAGTFGAQRLLPAGAFYVSLRGKFEAGHTRDEILDDVEARKLAFRHSGRFAADCLRKLDRRAEATQGDQFNYRLKKDGTLYASSAEALPSAEFDAMLDGVEDRLRSMGQEIFAGAAQVNPYRKSKMTPCEYCDYRAACRLDEWTHEWRVLTNHEGAASKSS